MPKAVDACSLVKSAAQVDTFRRVSTSRPPALQNGMLILSSLAHCMPLVRCRFGSVPQLFPARPAWGRRSAKDKGPPTKGHTLLTSHPSGGAAAPLHKCVRGSQIGQAARGGAKRRNVAENKI